MAGAGNRPDFGGSWPWVFGSRSWGLGSLPVFGSAGLCHFSILLKSLNYATFRGRDVSRDP